MTRLFLAAGVAALAIAAPATAKPGGGTAVAAAAQRASGRQQAAAVAAAMATVVAAAAARRRSAPADGGGGGGHGGGGGGSGRLHGGGGQRSRRRRLARPRSSSASSASSRADSNASNSASSASRQRPTDASVSKPRLPAPAGAGGRTSARGFERQQARDLERQQAQAIAPAGAASNASRRAWSNASRLRGNRDQQVRRPDARESAVQRWRRVPRQRQVQGQRPAGAVCASARSSQQNWDQSALCGDELRRPNLRLRPVTQVEQFVGAPVGQVASFAALSPLPTIDPVPLSGHAGLLLPVRRRLSLPGRSRRQSDRGAASALGRRLSAGLSICRRRT